MLLNLWRRTIGGGFTQKELDNAGVGSPRPGDTSAKAQEDTYRFVEHSGILTRNSSTVKHRDSDTGEITKVTVQVITASHASQLATLITTFTGHSYHTIQLINLLYDALAKTTLGYAIASNTTIETFEFPGVEARGAPIIFKALMDRQINFNNLRRNHVITKLVLSNCALKASDAEELVGVLAAGTTIKHLDLSHNDFLFEHETRTDEDIDKVRTKIRDKISPTNRTQNDHGSEKWSKAITEINQAIEAESLKQILEAKGLETLILSNTGIHEKGVEILKAAAENPTLTHLDAKYNHFDPNQSLESTLTNIATLVLEPRIAPQAFTKFVKAILNIPTKRPDHLDFGEIMTKLRSNMLAETAKPTTIREWFSGQKKPPATTIRG